MDDIDRPKLSSRVGGVSGTLNVSEDAERAGGGAADVTVDVKGIGYLGVVFSLRVEDDYVAVDND